MNALWAEVASFPVSDTTGALRCFLAEVCALVGATDGSWLALGRRSKIPREISADHYQTISNEMGGWTPMAAEYLNPEKVFKRVMDRWLMYARKHGVDPVSRVMLDGAGKFPRAWIRHDVATDDEWCDHWISRKYLGFYGVGERLVAMLPVNEDTESCIIIDRPVGSAPFTAEQRDFLRLAVAGIPSVHRRLFLERGLLGASSMLSKREMDTYRWLLTELSESEIADRMELSTHTVHDYARHLYKKFGVKGRIGLMALVLGEG